MKMLPDGPCQMCGHPFDDHHVVSLWDDPMDGGVVVCSEDDCDECVATWAAAGRPRPATPPYDVLMAIRAVARTRDDNGLVGAMEAAMTGQPKQGDGSVTDDDLQELARLRPEDFQAPHPGRPEISHMHDPEDPDLTVTVVHQPMSEGDRAVVMRELLEKARAERDR